MVWVGMVALASNMITFQAHCDVIENSLSKVTIVVDGMSKSKSGAT